MPFQLDLNKICQELEKKKCRIHNEHPKARVMLGKIHVTTCCDAFQKECEKSIDDEGAKQIDKTLGF